MCVAFVSCCFAEFILKFFGIFRVFQIKNPICKQGSPYFSFPIWMPFVSLSCLTAMVRTHSTMLNGSGESQHSYLVPDLRGNILAFHHYDVYWGGFSFGFYSVEVFLFLACWVFYHERVWNFVLCLSYINWNDRVRFFSLHSVDVAYCISHFSYIE